MTLSLPSSYVGFERLFDQLDRLQHSKTVHQSYPPHNIVKLNDGRYILELAVAGYKREDLTITKEKDTLIISTVDEYQTQELDTEYLHKGISTKKFRKSFTLNDNIKVTDATLEHGILQVMLEEEIPEEHKPKLIQIN